ncbi:MAG: nucleotidyltransferase domain-containing protein [Thermodesulfobacteriota bacterium]
MEEVRGLRLILINNSVVVAIIPLSLKEDYDNLYFNMASKIKNILNLLKKYKPEKVILFGSHARGSTDSYSDIDLIIIKRTKKPFLDRIKDVLKIIKPNFAIDVLVYTPEEFRKMTSEGNPFLEYVIKDGRVIYEKSLSRIKTMV